jgi:uncharacterized membrane protein (DUF485 family)
MANAAIRTEQHTKQSTKDLLESTDFKALVSRRWTVSFTLLALLFVSYYGYILVVATAKEFVSQKIGGGATTLAIPLGVAAIVIAFVLTAVYVSWANKSYDPEVERLKNQLVKR